MGGRGAKSKRQPVTTVTNGDNVRVGDTLMYNTWDGKSLQEIGSKVTGVERKRFGSGHRIYFKLENGKTIFLGAREEAHVKR